METEIEIKKEDNIHIHIQIGMFKRAERNINGKKLFIYIIDLQSELKIIICAYFLYNIADLISCEFTVYSIMHAQFTC